ncbi:MAG TPA: hypothetical protein VIJ14_09930 [Rhabdochlamydiaceae bacterium]
MGMTVSGTVIYGKPVFASLASMPAVTVAFSEAVFDKAYLTWLDVSKLLTTFPEHVKVLGDTVTFQGPVAIVSSMSPTRRLFAQCMLGIAAGVLNYLFLNAFASKHVRLPSLAMSVPIAPRAERIRKIQIAAFSFLVAGLAYYLAGRYLPTQAGVYFYKQPPFHV